MAIISKYKLYAKSTSIRNTFLLIIFGLLGVSVCAEPDTTTKSNPAGIIRRAAAEGKLAYRLTTPEEVKVLLGQPVRQEERDEGDLLVLEYPRVEFKFRRQSKIS